MCVVNKHSRNQCQYCKFEKCLCVGMNPERIQNKNAMTEISNKSYKKTVRTISCVDNYTIVRAIVIGIAYCQRLKIRSDMLRNYKNKKLQTKFLKAVKECKLLNTKVEINKVPILEHFLKKYKIIKIDKNFINNNHLIYINNKDKFEQEIYLHTVETGLNFIQSITSNLDGRNFCVYCVQIIENINMIRKLKHININVNQQTKISNLISLNQQITDNLIYFWFHQINY